MIITINGTPGSGKSTVARWLAEKLKLKHYSTGDFMRKMALEREIKVDELGRIGEKESWVDKEIDKYQTDLSKKEDNFVIDGRLSWYFMPKSVKIFMKSNLEKAAERIFKDKRESEKKYKNACEVLAEMKGRMKSEQLRYRKYYGIKNLYDLKNYDIVIDTSDMTIEEERKAVLSAILGFKKK